MSEKLKVEISQLTTEVFAKLLNVLEGFWEKKELSEKESLSFTYSCHEFYKDKTFQRIEGFLNMYPFSNKDVTLNEKTASLNSRLNNDNMSVKNNGFCAKAARIL